MLACIMLGRIIAGMRFLDRAEETARLDALVARRAAGLVALWGRRRVGKTATRTGVRVIEAEAVMKALR